MGKETSLGTRKAVSEDSEYFLKLNFVSACFVMVPIVIMGVAKNTGFSLNRWKNSLNNFRKILCKKVF